YSVIPPEGCAAILWRDPSKKVEAAEALKLTAADLKAREIIDEIIPEPTGGAHHDHDEAARLVDAALWPVLQRLMDEDPAQRLDRRYEKFRNIGRVGHELTDVPAVAADGAT